MTARTVTVHLKAAVGPYLAGMRLSEKAAKDLRGEVDKLNKAGAGMTKAGGISAALGGLGGIAATAAAGVAAVPAVAFSAGAALGTLTIATNGVGAAMSAVADGDSAKLTKALSGLTADAQEFVREYQRVKPLLDSIGDDTQSALFARLNGNLEMLTVRYIPTLQRQLPRVASALGASGAQFATWASAPTTVAKVSGQLDLAVELTNDFGRLLRSGTAALLDLADAGRGFAAGTVSGLADGTEALERWVANAKATGQLDQIFENATRVLDRLGDVTAETGDILFDVFANPALADGAVALLDVLGLSLDVVRALLTAFSSLPSGVQSVVVTLAVFGGATLAVTGRIVALKASLDAMKVSAIQAGGALKSTGSFLGGPWGAAVGIAATLLAVFTARNAEAEAAADALRGTLDKQTGAFTDSTREQVINQAAANDTIKIAKELGLNLDELTTALLGGSEATQRYYDEQLALAGGVKNAEGNWSGFRTRIQEVATAIDVAKVRQGDYDAAMGTTGAAIDKTTGKVRGQIAAIKELGDVLKAQTDPAFALIKAQKDLRTSQAEYNEAVKKHGAGSNQAKDASLALAEASVKLAGAVAAASSTFNGQLTPELRAVLDAAGLSEQQILDVEAAFKGAAKAGGDFAGDYTANVHANTAQAQKAITDLQLKVLGLKDKTIRVSASVYWTDSGLHVGTGTQQRRWGGIDYAMAQGGTIQAHHATSPTVLYGERATGGEAFIPKNGDPARSLGILSDAARWYGHQIMPANLPAYSSGGGGGGPVRVEVDLTVRGERGREIRQKLTNDAVGRGVPKTIIRAAYP